MPPSTSYIPLPGRSTSSALRTTLEPAFSTPVRISLAVLAWLAFGIASYLAWNAVTGSAVAGCSMNSGHGCDAVLSSVWSKWLGIPVAVLGLGCYAALASLSVLLWVRSEPASTWIATAFVMLSLVAALASIWFIGVQVIAIGELCKYCLVVDTCGILLGIIATTFAVRSWLADRSVSKSRGLQPGLMALRTALPSGAAAGATSPSPQTPMRPATPSPPALGYAFGGAVPMIVLLIAGQFIFRAKTWEVQKVTLTDSINLTDSGDGKTADDSKAPPEKPEGPTDGTATTGADGNSKTVSTADPLEPYSKNVADSDGNKVEQTAASPQTNDANTKSTAANAEPERLVKFLGGKLTLDTYKNPIIGSPDAPHIVVEIVSYDCPHCRKMHATMQQALKRYGDQVALLVMPIPYEQDCNKLITDPAASHRGACGTAKRAVAIARIDRSEFAKFHDFLMTGKDNPPVDKVIPKANGLVDRDRLRDLIRGPDVNKQIQGYIELFGKLKKGLPIQILGDHTISGSVEKPEDVFKAWEEHLGVKPK
jgi:uncharacterized membrane protein